MVQTGGVSQCPVARHVTVLDPVTWYPVLQLYVAVLPYVVVVTDADGPLVIAGGVWQSTIRFYFGLNL